MNNRIRIQFDNEHVFWTALIAWFIPVLLALSLFIEIIPNEDVILALIILFPILYLLIPITVIQLSTRYFSIEEVSLNSLWQGESPHHERNYVLYHVGFVWGIYFAIAQFGLLILMIPIAIVVFLVGLKKGWLL